MTKKMKVVWVCHFSNSELRKHIRQSSFYLLNHIRKRMGRPQPGNGDFGIWNANAIREMEKYDDIELHVILPYRALNPQHQEFSIRGVHYYCYRPDDDHIIPFIKDKVFKHPEKEYAANRKYIMSVIDMVRPDRVHIIGAENPYYSIAALDIPKHIPSIVSLQTLMSPPEFLRKSPQYANNYSIRVEIEQKVIRACTYIGTTLPSFIEFITTYIKPDAKYLPLVLAVGEEIDTSEHSKTYDFVYFAANIKKACDVAIEAFGMVCQKYPKATLNVSGGYDAVTKRKLDLRLEELGIKENVTFSGSKSSHQAVLSQIKKSRFALLPLKVDIISGTIREAMACGLPVVTTITEGTPGLNTNRESILLSAIGDIRGMADNMIRLMEDSDYAAILRKNAFATVKERYSNEAIVATWHKEYQKLVSL